MLNRGNVFAEKKYIKKVLPFGARGSLIMSRCVLAYPLMGIMYNT